MGTRLVAEPLLQRILRLRFITGFVTVYGESADVRTSVFARLWHVGRVVGLVRVLARRYDHVDEPRATLLAWLHDLNRWPFAHNTERGHFVQSRDTPSYLAGIHNEHIDQNLIEDLQGIQDKSVVGLSREARLVLMADTIAGLVEDPLLLVCGLNVRPEVVPHHVHASIGLAPYRDPWRKRCLELASLLQGPTSADDVVRFRSGFRSLFFDQVHATLDHLEAAPGGLNLESVLDRVRTVKEMFIRPIVFPINNELVCRGQWLGATLLPWYLRRYGSADLVLLTENEFVERTLQTPDCPFSSADFRPDLDIVARHQPDLAFIPVPAHCPRGASFHDISPRSPLGITPALSI